MLLVIERERDIFVFEKKRKKERKRRFFVRRSTRSPFIFYLFPLSALLYY